MIKQIFILFCALIPIWASAQSESTLLEGQYKFTFDQQTRVLQFSTLDRQFIEYDTNGGELGRGKVTYAQETYYLDPKVVSTYSIINGNLTVEVVEWLTDKVIVRVFLDDNHDQLVELIKL